MSAPWADTGDGVLLEHLSVATGAMMFIVSLKPKTLWVNDALVEQTGYTFEDYAFERFENPFIPPEDIAVVLAELTRFLASDDGVSREVRNRFVDRWGGTLHVRSRIAKILWKGEQALLYTTYLAGPDQAQAVELEQRYRSLVEAATDAIVRLTPALTVQFSNRSFQALVGKPPLELNSLRFTDLVAQSHRAELHRQLTSDAVTILPPHVDRLDARHLHARLVLLRGGERGRGAPAGEHLVEPGLLCRRRGDGVGAVAPS